MSLGDWLRHKHVRDGLGRQEGQQLLAQGHNAPRRAVLELLEWVRRDGLTLAGQEVGGDGRK